MTYDRYTFATQSLTVQQLFVIRLHRLTYRPATYNNALKSCAKQRQDRLHGISALLRNYFPQSPKVRRPTFRKISPIICWCRTSVYACVTDLCKFLLQLWNNLEEFKKIFCRTRNHSKNSKFGILL